MFKKAPIHRQRLAYEYVRHVSSFLIPVIYSRSPRRKGGVTVRRVSLHSGVSGNITHSLNVKTIFNTREHIPSTHRAAAQAVHFKILSIRIQQNHLFAVSGELRAFH